MNNIGQPAQPNRELVKCAIAEVSGIAGLTVRSMSEKASYGSESCLATMYDFLVAGVRVTGYEARTSKVTACATNEFVQGVSVNEFEAVAKSVSLASRSKNHHGSRRKREVQLHNLAQGRFKGKHRCDPGFADVNGKALQ
jgi:hypothetical protein